MQKKSILFVFVLILLTGLAWWSGSALGELIGSADSSAHFKRQKQDTKSFIDNNTAIRIGAKWPDASLQSLDGEWMYVSQIIRDTSLLMIMMPGCEACEEEMDAISDFLCTAVTADRIILISSAYPLDLAEVRRKRNIQSTVLVDRIGELFPLINALVFPMNIIVAPDLTIVSITAGGLSREQVEEIVK